MAGACDSVTRLLSPYADDELSGPDRAVVDEHLRGCPDCRARLADLQATHAALGGFLNAQAEAADFAGFTNRVMQQIRKEPLGFSQRARLWWTELMAYHAGALYTGVGAAAAAAAIAVIALRPGPQPVGGGLVMHSLQVSNPRYAPVVMHTADGDSVIMLVDQDADGGNPGPAPGAAQQPAQPAQPHGGNL